MKNLIFVFALALIFPWLSNAQEVQVISGLSHMFDSKPGSTHSDKLVLRNTSDKVVAIRVYQQDYMFNHNSQTFYQKSIDSAKSNLSWIAYNAVNIDVPANSDVEIPFTITVPETGDYKGTYWSVLMVEPVVALNIEKPDEGLGVATIFRFAVQIFNQFEDKGEQNLEYIGFTLLDHDTVMAIQVDIKNLGESMVKPSFTVDLVNLETGEMSEFFMDKSRKIVPNASQRYVIPLIGIPDGSYSATLVADCGNDDVFGINLELDLE